MKNVKEEEHPAYGVVSFSRIQGNPGRLFGSNLENHQTYVALRIAPARLMRENTRDWVYGSNKAHIEVLLSPAQFSELLTTMNMSPGVPCTISRLQNAGVPEIPNDKPTEAANIRQSFEQEINEMATALEAGQAKLDEILSRKTLNQKDRAEIKEVYTNILRNFRVNTSFSVTCFQEAAEKVVTEAKAHVDHFVTSALTKIGLDHLKDRFSTMSDALPERSATIDALPEQTE